MDKNNNTDIDRNEAFYGFDVSQIPWTDAYRLLVNCVAPRPIAFVSTLSKNGEPNLAPFSFFMAGGSNPPSVAFSPGREKPGQLKDTLINIKETGEYTINVVSHSFIEQMNQTSFAYPHGVSEWIKSGLTMADTIKVKPARAAESLMAMECRLFQIVHHGDDVGSANYVIGEIVYFHIAKEIMPDGRHIDPAKVDYVGRMGGNWYTRATPESMFELRRPERG